MFKDALYYSRGKEKLKTDWIDSLVFPDGFDLDEEASDEYAAYVRDIWGRLYLAKLNLDDDRTSYELDLKCHGIFENSIADQPMLESLKIPASLKILPEGSLSNGGGWAQMEKGLRKVDIDKANEKYCSDTFGVYEKLKKGKKLLLLLDTDTKIYIPKEIIEIGKDAFFGKYIEKVIFGENNFSYSFPKHRYFNEELLKSFGLNKKLYDFEAYDKFLLRDHFNADRIRMICERLSRDYEITREKREALFKHVDSSLNDALMAIVKENAVYELKAMTAAGFFTDKNIDESIDIINKTDKRELLTYLMDYKHYNFKNDGYDFSV